MDFRINQNGNLASAIVLSLIAVFSGLALTVMVMGDKANAETSFIKMQETHFLRTGIDRGQNFMTSGDNVMDLTVADLGVRLYEIKSGRSLTTYGVKTKVSTGLPEQENQIIIAKRGVKALVKAFKKQKRYVVFSSRDYNTTSRFKKYGERNIRKQTFAGFMYFTNSDISVNDDPVKFWGRDEIWGRVHSNTDIVLQNSSMPTFHDFVSCAGEIVMESGNPAPLNNTSVFEDGAEQNVPYIDYNPLAVTIRENGMHIEGQDILYIEVDGPNHIMCKGTINDLPAEVFHIYNQYPPYGPIGDSLMSSIITLQDTAWTSPVTGSLSDGSIFVHSVLWIHGNFGGKQTWGSEDDLFLVGDVTLVNTPVGDPPDGYNEAQDAYTGAVNRTDFVGLVSERRIFIKYAYENPVDTLIHWDNCGSESVEESGIYIYAAMAALGHGDGWEDGNFSYEYHYPHPSTPHAMDWQNTDETFWYPDLHLGLYPPNESAHHWPWPANNAAAGGFQYPANFGGMAWRTAGAPDYPWYNPVYPSVVMFYERGQIHLFGSVSQSRRGFVHRSGSDPLDTGHWDLSDPANPWFGTNCANSTGYGKRYHFDNRFNSVPPPDYPEVNLTSGGGSNLNGVVIFKEPPSNDIF